jgi:hypothetical protein
VRLAPLTQFRWRSNGASQSAPLLLGAYRKKPNGFSCAVGPFPMAHQWRKWWRVAPHKTADVTADKKGQCFTLKHCDAAPPHKIRIFGVDIIEV